MRFLPVLFLIFAGIIVLPCTGQGVISFMDESIEFILSDSNFSVNGMYSFRNNSSHPVEIGINYPFPVPLELIDTIHVFNTFTGQFFGFDPTGRGIHFPLRISGNDSLVLNIFYRQTVLSDTVIYILKTTERWGEPLKRADFSLTADSSVHIQSFSLLPDQTATASGVSHFYWSKKNFQPDQDFLIILRK